MSILTGRPGYYEEHYETLRREAVCGPPGRERGHGLALFLAQGMVAWMRALSTLSPLRSCSSPEPRPPAGYPKLTPSIQGELTTVLAAMVLACTRSPSHV